MRAWQLVSEGLALSSPAFHIILHKGCKLGIKPIMYLFHCFIQWLKITGKLQKHCKTIPSASLLVFLKTKDCVEIMFQSHMEKKDWLVLGNDGAKTQSLPRSMSKGIRPFSKSMNSWIHSSVTKKDKNVQIRTDKIIVVWKNRQMSITFSWSASYFWNIIGLHSHKSYWHFFSLPSLHATHIQQSISL